MARYNIWIAVEREDDETETYEDLGLPDKLGVFGSKIQAQRFARELLERYNPAMLETSDLKDIER